MYMYVDTYQDLHYLEDCHHQQVARQDLYYLEHCHHLPCPDLDHGVPPLHHHQRQIYHHHLYHPGHQL